MNVAIQREATVYDEPEVIARSAQELVGDLNPQQAEAVQYRGQALLIGAGAGSGKTRVLTRDELLNLAWGWDFDGTDRVIDGHIKKLRRALGPHADCIKTVVKRGYKLEVDGDENQT